MPQIDFKKDVLPHAIAMTVFFLLVFVFYSPVFLESKKIFQSDLLQWEGGAKELIDYRAENSKEALWTNSMFGGMPAYLVTLKYSGDISSYIHRVLQIGIPQPASQTFVAMLCFYILLLSFRVNPILAVIGAIGFGFTSFNIVNIEAGHSSKGWAIAYMSLVLAGIHMAFTDRRIGGFILTALGMALHTRVNHLQITYYLLMMVLVYGFIQLYLAIRDKQLNEFLKTIGILVIAVVISVGTSAGRMVGVYEYGKYSTRGPSALAADTTGQSVSTGGLSRDYVFSWSHEWGETLTLLVPNFCGGPSIQSLDRNSEVANALRRNGMGEGQTRNIIQQVPTYWGQLPFTAGPIYLGAVLIFACTLGLFLVEKRIRYWLLITCVLSILLSLGKNFPLFNYTLYDYLPGYNKFRAVTNSITMLTVAAPLLAVLGVQKLLNVKIKPKIFLSAAGWIVGILIMVVGYSYMADFIGPKDDQFGYPDWLLEALYLDRASLMRSDAIRSLILVVAAAGVLWAYMKDKIKPPVALIGFGLLVTLDLWFVAKRFIEPENFQRDPKRNAFALSESDELIKLDKDLSYRVVNLQNPWNEAFTSYHHKSIGGYHGAKLGRYQDLVERHLQNELQELVTRLNSGSNDMMGLPVVNMLNAKYLKAGPEKNAVVLNRSSLGNAWFVDQVIGVNNADEEIDRLGSLDPRKAALIDLSKFDLAVPDQLAKGTAQLVEYQPDRLTYEYESPGEGFLVFSEIYYPEGWTASIDGEDTDHYRVNYILRAMPVPAGSHRIEFVFAPSSYAIGNTINLSFSILFLLGLVGAVVLQVRSKRSS